jgi:phenylacetate-coenzyme A ligase PaaK-like adenylate-forming protein
LQPVDALVDALNAFAPTVLASYPTAALLLAEQAEQGRLKLGLRELWTGGETLSPAVRRRIETALGCSVRNSYGASEFLAMAWECEAGQLHLNTDWLVLEPVDEHNRPVPPGQPSCGVLLTNLANTVQPLIRYAMSDQVTVHTNRCCCGAPFPVVDVQGRRDDILRMRGLAGEVALLPLALSTVLEEQAGIFDFQLCQRDDSTLVLRLPLAGQAGRTALKCARAVLQSFALAQGALPIRVLGELDFAVPRGRSGKVCRVVARGG